MDVQTENNDPPPGESQPSGKIRKGFKLFGKRKPGNIFSIRSKGDANNKSPPARSNTLEGGTESTAPDQEHEASQGESGQPEEDPLSEDGVLGASPPPRASISSACSVKSLSFLSLLRGGRRGGGGGGGERQVQTVSQPVGRQRRGLKGLFDNVKFRQKEKEKEEAPPSPLLMSSRRNSVEIIKEDMPLTPRIQPRTLESPETERSEPVESATTTPASSATTPSETITAQTTAGSVRHEHVPPVPCSQPPMEPGETSLSCLLADISSLLTFDSISGGGDIMADVEAEWGKASSSEEKPSSTTFSSFKPVLSSSPTSTPAVSSTAAKPSPSAVRTTASTRPFTPATKPTLTSSPISQPTSIITTISPRSSNFSPHSVKSGSDLTHTPQPITTITIKSTPPVTSPVMLTSFSAPPRSSPPATMKPTPFSGSIITTAPPIPPAIVGQTPSISAMFNSMAAKSTPIPQTITPVSKASPVVAAAPPPASAKPTNITPSPPAAPVSSPHPPPAKSQTANVCDFQTSSNHKPWQSSLADEYKAPTAVSAACSIPPKLNIISSTMPTLLTSPPAPRTMSDPACPPAPVALNKAPPSLTTIPDPVPTLAPAPVSSAKPQHSPTPAPGPISSAKPQHSPTPAPAPTPVCLDKIPPTATPSLGSVSLDKAPPSLVTIPDHMPTPAPGPISSAKPQHSPTPAPGPISSAKPQYSPSPAPAPTPVSLDKIPPTGLGSVSLNKAPPSLISISDPMPTPALGLISSAKPQSSPTPAPAPTPVSINKTPPVATPSPASVSLDKLPPALTSTPAPTSRATDPIPTPSAPAPMSIPVSCAPPAPKPAPDSVDGQGPRTIPVKAEEVQPESCTPPQGPVRERRALSKIPVVGGGRAVKPPVRDHRDHQHHQHADDEGSSDPPTPVLEEERPPFHVQHGGSRDKISDGEASAPTSKHTPEESRQPQPQSKVISSLPRDSKIPVKQGAQSHSASQIPQAKEPPRTKIPVSKVPVRRIGAKPRPQVAAPK